MTVNKLSCRINSGEIPCGKGCARSGRRPSKLGSKAAALEAFRRTELTDDGGGVLVLGVDGVVEAVDAGRGELLIETPGRALEPVAQGLSGPSCVFIPLTGRSVIWDFVRGCQGRGGEGEIVSTNFDVSKGGLDLRHVAGDALAARRAGLVMGVLLKRGCAGAVGRHGAVAIETEFVSRLS